METISQLEIKASIQVLKPALEVYDAIVNPDKMNKYFIKESTGFMKEGEMVVWKFPEMDMSCDVKVDKAEKDKYISFFWDGADDGEDTFVEITLKEIEPEITLVTVTERSKANNEAGIIWLKRNTGGWASFLAFLKAWMEYGINLRKGAYHSSQIKD